MQVLHLTICMLISHLSTEGAYIRANDSDVAEIGDCAGCSNVVGEATCSFGSMMSTSSLMLPCYLSAPTPDHYDGSSSGSRRDADAFSALTA